MRATLCLSLLTALLASGACSDDSRSPTAPTEPLAPVAPQWLPATVVRSFTLTKEAGYEPLGTWRGSLNVQSTAGAPDCSSSPWQPGASGALFAEVLTEADDALDLHLVLPSESMEICHLELIVAEGKVRAAPWYDYFGDSSSCHYPLLVSEWTCSSTVEEVWILGIEVEGALENRGRRIRGTLTASYDYRYR
jgi:hypothetical protein